MQTTPWTVVTILPLLVLYPFIVRKVTNAVFGSAIADSRFALVLALTVLAVPTSGLFVLLGELFAIVVEIIRVRDGHLGDRTSTIPYIKHELSLFIIGVLLFLGVAYRRLWSGPGDRPDQLA
jgi:hypothetical protein